VPDYRVQARRQKRRALVVASGVTRRHIHYTVTTDRNGKKWRPFFDTRTRAASVPVIGRMRAVPETAARTDDRRFPTPV